MCADAGEEVMDLPGEPQRAQCAPGPRLPPLCDASAAGLPLRLPLPRRVQAVGMAGLRWLTGWLAGWLARRARDRYPTLSSLDPLAELLQASSVGYNLAARMQRAALDHPLAHMVRYEIRRCCLDRYTGWI